MKTSYWWYKHYNLYHYPQWCFLNPEFLIKFWAKIRYELLWLYTTMKWLQNSRNIKRLQKCFVSMQKRKVVPTFAHTSTGFSFTRISGCRVPAIVWKERTVLYCVRLGSARQGAWHTWLAPQFPRHLLGEYNPQWQEGTQSTKSPDILKPVWH